MINKLSKTTVTCYRNIRVLDSMFALNKPHSSSVKYLTASFFPTKNSLPRHCLFSDLIFSFRLFLIPFSQTISFKQSIFKTVPGFSFSKTAFDRDNSKNVTVNIFVELKGVTAIVGTSNYPAPALSIASLSVGRSTVMHCLARLRQTFLSLRSPRRTTNSPHFSISNTFNVARKVKFRQY